MNQQAIQNNTTPTFYKSSGQINFFKFKQPSQKHAITKQPTQSTNLFYLDLFNLEQIFPLFNNTFLFKYFNKIIHVDLSGEIIHIQQHQNIQQIIIISDREIVLMVSQKIKDTQKKISLIYWNLQTNTIINYFYKEIAIIDKIKLYYFPYTHLIGLVEQNYIILNQKISTNSLNSQPIYNSIQALIKSKITYFCLSDTSLSFNKIAQKILEFNKICHACCISTKMNNYSKLCFYTSKANHKQQLLVVQIQLNTFKQITVKKENQNSSQIIKIKQFTIKLEKILGPAPQFFNYWVNDMLEIDQQKIYLKIQTKADRVKYLSQLQNRKIKTDLCLQQKNHSLIFNRNNKLCIQLLKDQNYHSVQFSHDMKKIQRKRYKFYKSFQQRCLQRGLQIESATLCQQIPIYYINSQSLQISNPHQQSEQKIMYSTTYYCYCDYNPYLENKFQIKNQNYMTKIWYQIIQSHFPFSLQELSTFFVKEIIEDNSQGQNFVCDDLLEQICKLVANSQQIKY